MNLRSLAFFIALIFFTLAGCTNREHVNIIFKVGEKEFTEQMLRDEKDLKIALYSHRLSQKKQKLRDGSEQRIVTQIITKKIDEMLLLNFAEQNHAKFDPATLKSVQDNYARTFGAPNVNYTELKNAIGHHLAAVLDHRVEETARLEACLNERYAEQLHVSENLIDETIAQMRVGDARAQETNAIIYALATNVWQRAKAGEDFARLADKYTQESGANPGGDLGAECTADDFKIEKDRVWAAISLYKAGEVTPPMDTTEGLTIFKIYSVTNETDVPIERTCHLARIVFHRALCYENYDRDYIRSELKRDRRGKVLSGILKEIRKTASISFQTNAVGLPLNFVKSCRRRYGTVTEKDFK